MSLKKLTVLLAAGLFSATMLTACFEKKEAVVEEIEAVEVGVDAAGDVVEEGAEVVEEVVPEGH